MNDRVPELRKTAFVCPHCRAHAQQSWFSTGTRTISADGVVAWDRSRIRDLVELLKDPKTEEERGRQGTLKSIHRALENGSPGISNKDTEYMRPTWNMWVSVCFSCGGEALWLDGKIIYPARSSEVPAPNADLPAEIAADYEEAATIVHQSPRAAAALLRLAIEKLCAGLLPERDDINTMIGNLVQRGLNPTIQQALDVVRVVGNEAVHPGVLDLRDDTATASRLFALVNLIAEAMISHPKHVAELYSMLPENKLKGIEQRDKPRSR